MNKAEDYIISLTHLYGLVHQEKVVEIYNLQNEEKIDKESINRIITQSNELSNNFVYVHGDYFVVESILQYQDFETELKKRLRIPFYIPEQAELLQYKDNLYFEMTKGYRALLNYLTIHFFNGDEYKANMLCDDIQLSCQVSFSLQDIFREFERRRVKFRDEKQISEVTELILDLANNTRVPENNGYTPRELFELGEIPNLRQLPLDTLITTPGRRTKVGRNDPCPCGSGKKYKKCCLGKV